MDPEIDTIYGPHPLQKPGTVTVPDPLVRALGLMKGTSKVHWALNPTIPGTLILIPTALYARATDEILELLATKGS